MAETMTYPYILIGGHKNLPEKYWARVVTSERTVRFNQAETRATALQAALESVFPLVPPVLDYKQCIHCLKENNDEFMVGPTVWARAELHSAVGRIHLHCLEERIKRPLILADFTPANCNIGIKFGYEMALNAMAPKRFSLEKPDDESVEDDWVVHDWLLGENLGDEEGEIIYIGRANADLALAHAKATAGGVLRLDIDDDEPEVVRRKPT